MHRLVGSGVSRGSMATPRGIRSTPLVDTEAPYASARIRRHRLTLTTHAGRGVLSYVRALLMQYAQLQTEPVSLHPAALPL